jgi:hypothetical protein
MTRFNGTGLSTSTICTASQVGAITAEYVQSMSLYGILISLVWDGLMMEQLYIASIVL